MVQTSLTRLSPRIRVGWSDPSAPAHHSHFMTKAQRIVKQQAKERRKLLRQKTLIEQRSESRRAHSMSSFDVKSLNERPADSPTGVGSFKNTLSDTPGNQSLAQTPVQRSSQRIPQLVSTMETLFRLHDESMRELADSTVSYGEKNVAKRSSRNCRKAYRKM